MIIERQGAFGPSVTLARLPDGEDWLMRPVLRGLIPLESLFRPGLGLEAFALANDALDVADENERRLAAASKE